MAGWIVLLTDRTADPGRARVGAIPKGDGAGGPVWALSRARVYSTREEAKADASRVRKSWLATVAPADGPGIPPLPG